MSRKDWGFSRKRSSVERTRVWVELWSLAYSVALDTHEVVKHMITLEDTFDWYNTESNLRRVYMYISIALNREFSELHFTTRLQFQHSSRTDKNPSVSFRTLNQARLPQARTPIQPRLKCTAIRESKQAQLSLLLHPTLTCSARRARRSHFWCVRGLKMSANMIHTKSSLWNHANQKYCVSTRPHGPKISREHAL